MDWITDTLGIEPSTQGKILASFIAVVVILTLRVITTRFIARRTEDATVIYRSRKMATYAASIVILITLSFVWLEAFDDLTTYLGLVSAGLAIALADLLKNIAGWFYILIRRPFRVGDRIEISGTHGDVVDVRIVRFTLIEIGNWVAADQPTGRLVHIPNGLLFTESVANYTEGFDYIWDEIPVLITFESDWQRAEQVIGEVVATEVPEMEAEARALIRRTSEEYELMVGSLGSSVYVSVRDSGVELTARYIVEARDRRNVEEQVWRGILTAFQQEERIELAYPTTRTYFAGPVDVAVDRDPGSA